jgi:hypothetical protein
MTYIRSRKGTASFYFMCFQGPLRCEDTPPALFSTSTSRMRKSKVKKKHKDISFYFSEPAALRRRVAQEFLQRGSAFQMSRKPATRHGRAVRLRHIERLPHFRLTIYDGRFGEFFELRESHQSSIDDDSERATGSAPSWIAYAYRNLTTQ